MITFPGWLIDGVKANASHFKQACHPIDSKPLPYENVESFLEYKQYCSHFWTDAPD